MRLPCALCLVMVVACSSNPPGGGSDSQVLLNISR
jgi:hypothetical protein